MNTAVNRKKQTGAVTLMGALFIIITVALMVIAINRMAASNITDTAIQNDAVEALFIAETGIEYASYRYANGTACATLETVIDNTSSGRGSFDVTGSIVNGADCSITVTASVSSVGAGSPDAAQRTVTADLRLSSGGVVAVGENGTILRWNGTAWVPEISNTTEDLMSVYCPSANECWATGTDRIILHWTGGTTWTQEYISNDGSLNGVACEPSNPSNCYTVGLDVRFKGRIDGVTLRWDGVSWTGALGSLPFNYYEDISCPDANCYAVAINGDAYTSASNWSSDSLNASVDQHGIDCFGSIDCWSVGDTPSTNTFRFYRRDNTGWAAVNLNANGDAENLRSVSCPSASACKAVGDRRGGQFTIVGWDGGAWAVESFNHNNRENLNGVHCSAADNCWAVGDYRNPRPTGNSLFWDGATWAYVGTPMQLDLNDVFVIDAGGGTGGAVSLVRWEEIITN